MKGDRMIGVDMLIGIAIIVALLLIGMTVCERAARRRRWHCPVCRYTTFRRVDRAAHLYVHMSQMPQEEREQT